MRHLRSPRFRTSVGPALALLVSAVSACALTACADVATEPQQQPDPGTPVTTTPSSEQQAELQAIEEQLATCDGLTAATFEEQHALPQTAGVSYDPAQAANLSLIQASALALDAGELAGLSANGFVLSDKKRFPTFVYGYESIYALDLPVYISADSILYAVHRSFDSILAALETGALIPELDGLLTSMRASLSAGGASGLGAQARADADLYVAVAEALLTGQSAAPVAGASATEIDSLVAGAKAASGAQSVTLFGATRDVDFSQFTPRGHYTDSEELSRYFRAMIWLGRIDLRMIETQPDHSQVFHRRQLEGAMALGALMDDASRAGWSRIHDAIAGFVGEPDSMTVPQLKSLMGDLGVTDPADLAAIPDATIAQAIMDGGYGTQKIASHIMVNGLGSGTMPLSSSFLLFGQAYVIDSHVFSNVVYDRVQKGQAFRMMPDPLDVAFAALKNDQAASLLDAGLQKYSYAPDLCSMRVLADAHGDEFWQDSLYNLWLSSLRALSPTQELADPVAAGLPSLAATEPWGRRILSTQLASWAELRHDTILYAKQSYTGGATCEFPDAYVDPYPTFYGSLAAYAEHGKAIVGTLDFDSAPWLKETVPAYFDRLQEISTRLQAMAEEERTGTPFTQEQMDFINKAVKVQLGCGDPAGAEGWYADLFFDVLKSVEVDPTIADVHTQPTDEAGNPVGKVLHVATGMPRLMVVTLETCTGPHAYAGLASSYFERVTTDYERLQDETWAKEVQTAHPDDVPWMKDLVVR